MRVLVDTNVRLRSAQPSHPLCPQATYAVSKLLRQKDAVFFCSQNIAEFWNVASRPAEMNGLGFSQEEILEEVNSIENLLTLLPDIPAIYPIWKRIVQDHRVQGVKVYDARLVAVMSVYPIDSVLTFNVASATAISTLFSPPRCSPRELVLSLRGRPSSIRVQSHRPRSPRTVSEVHRRLGSGLPGTSPTWTTNQPLEEEGQIGREFGRPGPSCSMMRPTRA